MNVFVAGFLFAYDVVLIYGHEWWSYESAGVGGKCLGSY
jgi:hypothetical protein